MNVSGNMTLTGTGGGAHSNGHWHLDSDINLDACLSSAGGYSAEPGAAINQPADCPSPPGDQLAVTLPAIVPEDVWGDLVEFDYCPDGRVRRGPQHDEVLDSSYPAPTAPCTGSQLANISGGGEYKGWKLGTCCDTKLGATWTYEEDSPNNGVFYFHEGTPIMAKNPGTSSNPWEATIIASSEHVGSCDLIGGDIVLSGNPFMAAHSKGKNLTLMAGRDLDWSGNPDQDIHGIVAVHEQLQLSGNPNITGVFAIEDACDSSENSNFHEK